MTDQKNTILAIVLSAVVLIAWQYFIGTPQMEKQKQEAQLRSQQQQTQPIQNPAKPGESAPTPAPGQPAAMAPGGTAPGATMTREAALAASPRIAIQTPRLSGSISLKGARIDDVALTHYRETVDPKSPAVVLLAPSGSPHPFYAEFGWVGAAGASVKAPGGDTLWQQQGTGALGVGKPVTLTYDNGEGLEFRRTIAVDDNYMFTIQDQVTNKGAAPVALYPFGLISRHGLPATEGYYILHEGMVGIFGEQGLQEITYKTIEDKKQVSFKTNDVWLGMTDKYWAATLIPDAKSSVQASFKGEVAGTAKKYQADYLGDVQTVAPGASTVSNTRLFAGAKEVSTLNHYKNDLGIDRFDMLIDWGYFYFITKPMFWAIDYLYKLLGNFGLAILGVTVLVKFVFFPLANKSYASMAKMKAVQPQMTMIRDRYKDDKVKQQQALMELYKKEKINPIAGCLPILIQVPVFFALYKVLFITIEMRHAPFYGWIKDLSAPDPTNLFTLFGLLPIDPTVLPVIGHFLHIGIWPLIMGVTMFLQMKLNPAPPDPTQKMIFDWMPVIFTFMLGSFSAGLVIYWAWNNTLSVLQQSIIMHKNGAKIALFDNIKGMFVRDKADHKT